MPMHQLHITADMLILGHPFIDVHKYMDIMQPIMQSSHRQYNHDDVTIARIYQSTGDPLAAWSAYYHIKLDEISDKVGQEFAVPVLIQLIKDRKIPNPWS